MSEARLHLDAVITGNRSLSRTGLWVLLGGLLFVNAVLAIAFLIMGAALVPVFLGLDVAAVALAFWINDRHGRRRERVQVTAEHVQVLQERGEKARTVWSSPTAFTRVSLDETGRYGAQVRLSLSGRRHTIGAMLSPPERADLCDAVERAIRSARAERHAT